MSRGMGPRLWLALATILAGTLWAASAAHAYEVRISVKGGGTVTETTAANLVTGCSLPSSVGNNGTSTCFAGTPTGDYGFGWDVDYLATPAAGYTFIGWQSDGSTRAGVVCDRSTPPATGTNYAGTACKFRTFDNLQTMAVFRDNTVPSAPLVGSAPAGAVSGAVSFSLLPPSDPTFSHLVCSLSGPAPVPSLPCSAPSVSVNPSQSGQYTLTVHAVDYSGNTSAGVQRAFTVDKTPPETTINPSVGPAPGAAVSSKSATFSFTSSEPGSLLCTLDGATRACSPSSPLTLSDLTEGEHVLRVRAVDPAGNADPTPAERRWTVDTIAPDVTLDPAVGPGEGATVRSADALFRFTASEPGATVHCALDGNELAACASPLVVNGLGDGPHALRVWAVDAAGNADETPAERHWTVDAVDDPVNPPPTQPPTNPGGPGGPTAACGTAKRSLAAAQAKLRKLKAADAPAAKVRKAKKRVRKLKGSMQAACSA